MDIYREIILDHYNNPRYFGLDHNRSDAVVTRGFSPSCGDDLQVQVVVREGKISFYRFEGESCAIARACASMLGDVIDEKLVSKVLAMRGDAVADMLGFSLPPARLSCGMLALDAVQRGLAKVE